MPRVSVIIPTYNRCDLTMAAVDSVLAQSYRDFEVIVVDDGSTDGTPAAFSTPMDRVLYVRQSNGGVNAARNTGLAHASGELIALLDNDDLWEPFKLEIQVALLERFPSAVFVFSDFNILKDGAPLQRHGLRTWHRVCHDWSKFYSEALPMSELLPESACAQATVYIGDIYGPSLFEPFVLPTTAVFRRSAVQAPRPFPEDDSICGDWEFFAKLSKHGRVLFLDVETAHNRSHEDAVRLTRTKISTQLAKRIAMIDRTWRADSEFLETRGADVDATQYDLLLRLAKLQLLESDNASAQVSLRRASRFTSRASKSLTPWSLLAAIPGCGTLLRGVRALRDLAMRRV